MQTLDLKKELKLLYAALPGKCMLVDVPPLNFLMIDGAGNPNSAPAYAEAVQALYTLAYTLKFSLKKAGIADYPVMASEGLWWMEDMTQFTVERKDDWLWTMMIMQPEVVTPQAFAAARAEAEKKKPNPALARVRLERYAEGLSAQIMHIGPYSTEAPTIQHLHAFIKESGFALRGKHHEIYLGDPRRSDPAKLKTIIRQPVQKQG